MASSGNGDGAVRMRELEKQLASLKAELAAKVKHYEGKLVTLTVINGALQGENEKLKEAAAQGPGGGDLAGSKAAAAAAEQELKELHAEFTKRLNAAEKAAHTFREECFALRRQVEDLKKGKEKMEAERAERDASVSQYKREGDALARRLAEVEAAAGRQRAESAKLEQERERLQSRVQVLEAAAQSADVSRAAALEETQQDLAALRHAMQEQKTHFNQLMEEMRAKAAREAALFQEQLRAERQRAAHEVEERERALAARTLALQQSLVESERASSLQEHKLREEIHRLTLESRAAEAAAEEAQSSLSEATRPLARQIESLVAEQRRMEGLLQEQEGQMRATRESLERELQEQQQKEAKAAAAAAESWERARGMEAAVKKAREEAQGALARAREMESECQAARAREDAATERALCAEAAHRDALEALSAARVAQGAAERAAAGAGIELEVARRELQSLGRTKDVGGEVLQRGSPVARPLILSSNSPAGSPQPSMPRAGGQSVGPRERSPEERAGPLAGTGAAGGGRENGLPQGHPGVRADPAGLGAGEGGLDPMPHPPLRGHEMGSPAQSAVAGGDSPLQQVLGTSATAAGGTTAAGGGAATAPAPAAGVGTVDAVLVERLTSKLKQQQGELAQLHKEAQAARSAREHVERELLSLSQRLLGLQKAAGRTAEAERELEELRRRHDMALVLIGERNERLEEMEQDMADVKAMYREQVSLLVGQVDPGKWPDGYRICLFCPHCAQGERARARQKQ